MDIKIQVADKWDIIVPIIQAGFSAAVVVAIIVAATNIGWRLAPYVLAAAMFIYFVL